MYELQIAMNSEVGYNINNKVAFQS